MRKLDKNQRRNLKKKLAKQRKKEKARLQNGSNQVKSNDDTPSKNDFVSTEKDMEVPLTSKKENPKGL